MKNGTSLYMLDLNSFNSGLLCLFFFCYVKFCGRLCNSAFRN